MNHLLWLIPCLPLFGSLIISTVNGLPTKTYSYIGNLSVFLTALLVGMLWVDGTWNQPVTQELFNWMHVGYWNISIDFRIDKVTLIMCSVTSWVGFLIHMYSVQYMEDKAGSRRYFAYLNMFVGEHKNFLVKFCVK